MKLKNENMIQMTYVFLFLMHFWFKITFFKIKLYFFSNQHNQLETVEALDGAGQVCVVVEIVVVSPNFDLVVDGIDFMISVVNVLVILVGDLAIVNSNAGSVVDVHVLCSFGTHF